MKDRLDKAVEFLKERSLLSWQWFDSRNFAGDYMETIYDEDGITIDICYGYRYIEIFGLTPEETERFSELSTFKY